MSWITKIRTKSCFSSQHWQLTRLKCKFPIYFPLCVQQGRFTSLASTMLRHQKSRKSRMNDQINMIYAPKLEQVKNWRGYMLLKYNVQKPPELFQFLISQSFTEFSPGRTCDLIRAGYKTMALPNHAASPATNVLHDLRKSAVMPQAPIYATIWWTGWESLCIVLFHKEPWSVIKFHPTVWNCQRESAV